MTPDQNWDCLCAGIVVADFFCAPIAQFPPPGGLILTDGLQMAIGGCAANVAVDLAKLGRRVAISACVGDDLFGRAVCDMLARERVDISSIQPVAEVPTSGTFVINVRGEDRRFIHCIGSNGVYDGRQITRDQLGRSRSLYVGGFGLLESLSPEAVARLFLDARELGVPTLLDVVLPAGRDFASSIAPVLPFTDVFFPNTDEAAVLLGETDPVRQAREFLRLGVRTVIVTCGADGAVIGTRDALWKCGVHPVEAVDATGTGDAFVAGFIHALLDRKSLEECIRAGAALGASCVRSMGATTGVFSADELAGYLATHPLPLTEI